MPNTTRHWYAIYTRPRWEKKVHALLVEKDVETYCPLNKVQKKWSDRLKWVEEPLFKSYLFVRVTEEEMPKVRLVHGVVNYVYWLGKPAIVRDSEIRAIRKFLNEYTNVRLEPIDLRPNEKVRIQSGLLMDEEAKILRVRGKRVQIVIESLRYSLVAIVDRSNLRRVSKPVDSEVKP
jgi:transcription antitermination factor NusG